MLHSLKIEKAEAKMQKIKEIIKETKNGRFPSHYRIRRFTKMFVLLDFLPNKF